MAAGSIFARLIAREIPCQCVFENDLVFAFLDINPLADGHTLIVPKRTVARPEDLTADEARELGRQIPLLARRILAATGAHDYNVLANVGSAAGQEVPHVHFHIIPRRPEDGLGYRWRPQKAEPARLGVLAERIRSQP